MAESDRKRKTPSTPENEGGSEEPARKPAGKGEPGKSRAPRGLFGFLAVLTVGLIALMLFTNVGDQGRSITWREFKDLYTTQQIMKDSITIEDTAIRAKQKADKVKGGEQSVFIRISPSTRETSRNDLKTLTNGDFRETPTSIWTQMLVVTLPFLLVLMLLMFFFFRGLQSAAGGPGGVLGNFGKSRHKMMMKEKTGITFDDVAGIDEAKDEVGEIIEFLKHPKKFMRLGGRIPRGVLLVGEPGCGKTLLAKAIAGEADVPFFSISGSDFVEMFVGVGASRVRDLFKQAKESAPCIIFLDEIDAVGRRRGGGFTTGGHDEREQTLNAILVEMDGFNPSDGVIVVAATNRNDVLDPALVRPGRFDRQVTVPLPDVKGRLDILKVHSKKVKLGPDLDLERIAKATPMFSGADLAAIINEAAISATMQNKDWIEHEDLEEARDKVKFGRAKKSRVREAEDNRLVAYHEAGHAVLQALQKDGDPLHKVTIISRGGMGGTTFSLPAKDRMGYGLKWLLSTMRTTCGGRIAEMKAMGDMSSGASMDIAQVTNLARLMIEQWGMSEKLGFVRYAGSDTREMYVPDKDFSDATAQAIDDEVRSMVRQAYRDAETMLEANWEKVVAVAEALLRHETLSADEVNRLMRGETLGRPTVSELLSAEARKNRAAAAAAAMPAGNETPEIPPGALPA